MLSITDKFFKPNNPIENEHFFEVDGVERGEIVTYLVNAASAEHALAAIKREEEEGLDLLIKEDVRQVTLEYIGARYLEGKRYKVVKFLTHGIGLTIDCIKPPEAHGLFERLLETKFPTYNEASDTRSISISAPEEKPSAYIL